MRNVQVGMIASAAFVGVAIVAWTLTNSPSSNYGHDALPTHRADDANIDSRPTSQISMAENIQKSSTIRFVDVASASGISFVYHGSPSPEHFMTEQNGGGIAVFDFDADGVVDLFFSNGSHFNSPAADHQVSNELYRSTSALQYESVTERADLVFSGVGQGTAAADYDNDGFTDLFVSYFGRNQLWKNNGDGTFTNVTEIAGVGDERWATSAAFADLDADGALDLYVVNYVDWTPDAIPCFLDSHKQQRKVCSPLDFNGPSGFVVGLASYW